MDDNSWRFIALVYGRYHLSHTSLVVDQNNQRVVRTVSISKLSDVHGLLSHPVFPLVRVSTIDIRVQLLEDHRRHSSPESGNLCYSSELSYRIDYRIE
jgi:hypothetical protein